MASSSGILHFASISDQLNWKGLAISLILCYSVYLYWKWKKQKQVLLEYECIVALFNDVSLHANR